jgi:Secretion system C-terminal sorting domain
MNHINQTIMQPKSMFKLAIFAIALMGITMNTMAEYVKDPTLCNGVDASWDPSARKFTVKGLHGSIIEPWIAYLTDPSWCSTCYVDICPYGTYTPGSSTFTSSRLGTSYGDPLKNGANGSSALFIALKSVNNDLPKGAKTDDCNVTCDGTCLAELCKGVTPTYCDNFDATFSGSTINVRGIFNCSNDNLFMFATPDFSKWATVTIKVDPTDPNKASADVSELTYFQSSEKVYPYTEGVMFLMNSDDKGGGPSGRGRNYCSESFEQMIYDSWPICDKCGCDIYKCYTECKSVSAFMSEDKRQLIITGPGLSLNSSSYDYIDKATNSIIYFEQFINTKNFSTTKNDTVYIELTKCKYSSGPLKDSLIKLPLIDTLKVYNTGTYCKNYIDLKTAKIWTSLSSVYTGTESKIIVPNPATPSETITIQGEYASDAKVSITSTSGSMLGSVTPTVGADAMTVSLSGLNLQAGIYFLRIESGEKVFSGKLCVK